MFFGHRKDFKNKLLLVICLGFWPLNLKMCCWLAATGQAWERTKDIQWQAQT